MSDLVEITPPTSRPQTTGSPAQIALQAAAEPPAPSIPDDIRTLLETTLRAVGRVVAARDLSVPHKLIAQALARDDARRQKFAASPYDWNKPIFDTPVERRRLRILQGLFLALERQHCKPSMHAKEARDLSVLVGDVWVSFSLDYPKAEAERERWNHRGTLPDSEQLSLRILIGKTEYPFRTEWVDTKESPMDQQLPEIVAALITAAEIALQHARQRDEEYEKHLAKVEIERQQAAAKELAREQIRGLYREARNWRRAESLRAYIGAFVESGSLSPDEMRRWKDWAIAEADRIHPEFKRGPAGG